MDMDVTIVAQRGITVPRQVVKTLTETKTVKLNSSVDLIDLSAIDHGDMQTLLEYHVTGHVKNPKGDISALGQTFIVGKDGASNASDGVVFEVKANKLYATENVTRGFRCSSVNNPVRIRTLQEQIPGLNFETWDRNSR